MPKKNKDIVNNNKITINLSDVLKEKKDKKRKKKLRRRLLKEKEIVKKQFKPPLSNFQYPAPVVVNAINPQQQKQLNLDYDKKLAQVLQTKFDEEYKKRENEKVISKPGEKATEPIQSNVGAFNSVFDNRGFSREVDMLSKENDNFRTGQFSTQRDNSYNNNSKLFQSVLQLPDENIYAEPIVAKAQKFKEFNCSYCNNKYASQNNLDKHIREKHSNEISQIIPQPIDEQPQTKPPNKPLSIMKKIDENSLDFMNDPFDNSPVKTVRRLKSKVREQQNSELFTTPNPIPTDPIMSEIDKALNPQIDTNISTNLNNDLNEINNILETYYDPEPGPEPINQNDTSIINAIEDQQQQNDISIISAIEDPQQQNNTNTYSREELRNMIQNIVSERNSELDDGLKTLLSDSTQKNSKTRNLTLIKYLKILGNNTGDLTLKEFNKKTK